MAVSGLQLLGAARPTSRPGFRSEQARRHHWPRSGQRHRPGRPPSQPPARPADAARRELHDRRPGQHERQFHQRTACDDPHTPQSRRQAGPGRHRGIGSAGRPGRGRNRRGTRAASARDAATVCFWRSASAPTGLWRTSPPPPPPGYGAPPPPPQKKGVSCWVWGCGCLFLIVLVFVLIGVYIYFFAPASITGPISISLSNSGSTWSSLILRAFQKSTVLREPGPYGLHSPQEPGSFSLNRRIPSPG